jgi:hypothetical protein
MNENILLLAGVCISFVSIYFSFFIYMDQIYNIEHLYDENE